MTATGNEYVKLSQLKMLSDNLESDILGQFSDELDTIIGGDTTPVTDITARLAVVNGTTGNVDAQLDTLDGTKSAIKDAIIAKGVEVPEGTVFRDYAGKIAEIESGASGNKVNVEVSNPSSSSIALFYYNLNNNSYVVSTLDAGGSTNIGTLTGQYLVAAYDGVNCIHTCSMGGSMYANKLFAVLIPEYASEEQLIIMND